MRARVEKNHPSSAGSAVVEVINASGKGGYVLVCEHASNKIPDELNALGLAEATLASHIAWDPGALAVAREMARCLDAPLVAQCVSRLVYDCNRPPESQSAVPRESEIYQIPGNAALTPAALAARAEAYYFPFKAKLTDVLDQHGDSILLTIHSFTPNFFGEPREVEIGILHDADARLADEILAEMAASSPLITRRNEPYGPRDGVTHTLVTHALPRGMLNVMFEIRNDLIKRAPEQQAMGRALAARVLAARARLQPGPTGVR